MLHCRSLLGLPFESQSFLEQLFAPKRGFDRKIDLAAYLSHLERLGDEIVAAAFVGQHPVVLRITAGHEHDGHVLVPEALADLPARFIAVHAARHVDVQKNDVR